MPSDLQERLSEILREDQRDLNEKLSPEEQRQNEMAVTAHSEDYSRIARITDALIFCMKVDAHLQGKPESRVLADNPHVKASRRRLLERIADLLKTQEKPEATAPLKREEFWQEVRRAMLDSWRTIRDLPDESYEHDPKIGAILQATERICNKFCKEEIFGIEDVAKFLCFMHGVTEGAFLFDPLQDDASRLREARIRSFNELIRSIPQLAHNDPMIQMGKPLKLPPSRSMKGILDADAFLTRLKRGLKESEERTCAARPPGRKHDAMFRKHAANALGATVSALEAYVRTYLPIAFDHPAYVHTVSGWLSQALAGATAMEFAKEGGQIGDAALVSSVVMESMHNTMNALVEEYVDMSEQEPAGGEGVTEEWQRKPVPKQEVIELSSTYSGDAYTVLLHGILLKHIESHHPLYNLTWGERITRSTLALNDAKTMFQRRPQLLWGDWIAYFKKLRADISLRLLSYREVDHPAARGLERLYSMVIRRLEEVMERHFRENALPEAERAVARARPAFSIPHQIFIKYIESTSSFVRPIEVFERNKDVFRLVLQATCDSAAEFGLADLALPLHVDYRTAHVCVNSCLDIRKGFEARCRECNTYPDEDQTAETLARNLRNVFDAKFNELTEGATITAAELDIIEMSSPGISPEVLVSMKRLRSSVSGKRWKAYGDEIESLSSRDASEKFTYVDCQRRVLQWIDIHSRAENDFKAMGAEIPPAWAQIWRDRAETQLKGIDTMFLRKTREKDEAATKAKLKKPTMQRQEVADVFRQAMKAHVPGDALNRLSEVLSVEDRRSYTTLFNACVPAMINAFYGSKGELTLMMEKDELFRVERSTREMLSSFERAVAQYTTGNEAQKLHAILFLQMKEGFTAFAEELQKQCSAPWVQEWIAERGTLDVAYPKPTTFPREFYTFIARQMQDIFTHDGRYHDYKPAVNAGADLEESLRALQKGKQMTLRSILTSWERGDAVVIGDRLVAFLSERPSLTSAAEVKAFFSLWREQRAPLYERIGAVHGGIAQMLRTRFELFEDDFIRRIAEQTDIPGMADLLAERAVEKRQRQEEREQRKRARLESKRNGEKEDPDGIEGEPQKPAEARPTDVEQNLDAISVRPKKRWEYLEAMICGALRTAFDGAAEAGADVLLNYEDIQERAVRAMDHLRRFGDACLGDLRTLRERDPERLPSSDDIIAVVDRRADQFTESEPEGQSWLGTARRAVREELWVPLRTDPAKATLLPESEILTGVREVLSLPPAAGEGKQALDVQAFYLTPDERAAKSQAEKASACCRSLARLATVETTGDVELTSLVNILQALCVEYGVPIVEEVDEGDTPSSAQLRQRIQQQSGEILRFAASSSVTVTRMSDLAANMQTVVKIFHAQSDHE